MATSGEEWQVATPPALLETIPEDDSGATAPPSASQEHLDWTGTWQYQAPSEVSSARGMEAGHDGSLQETDSASRPGGRPQTQVPPPVRRRRTATREPRSLTPGDDTSKCRSVGFWAAMGCALLLGVVVAIFFIVRGAGTDETSLTSPVDTNGTDTLEPEPTLAPFEFTDIFAPSLGPSSLAPSAAPSYALVDVLELQSLLEQHVVNASTLTDPSTPQAKAFQWMIRYDQLRLTVNQNTPDEILQRFALVVLYYSMEGWNIRAHVHECFWEGVYCTVQLSNGAQSLGPSGDTFVIASSSSVGSIDSNNDTVQVLFMESQNLTGTLPGELSLLCNLLEVWFFDNLLHGSIPEFCESLALLDLADNALTGQVPASIWTRLNYLTLYENLLTGLQQPTSQDELLGLDAVEVMFLDDNRMTGTLPPQVAQLPQLQILFLRNNFLVEMPDDWSQATSLTYLDASSNALDMAIPTSLLQLDSLTYLRLDQNAFTGSIPAMNNSSLLQLLFLNSNQLNGTIPSELGQDLQYILLQDNQLVGSIPSEIARLTQLEYLIVHDNDLTHLPNDWSQATSLQVLDVSNNTLATTIPSSLLELFNLTLLYMENNQLWGTLPTGNYMGLMEDLWLHSNQLSGSIPRNFGLEWNLTRLRLHDNRLTGRLTQCDNWEYAYWIEADCLSNATYYVECSCCDMCHS